MPAAVAVVGLGVLYAAQTAQAATAGAVPAPTFSMSPGHGPSGTLVQLRSVTPCPPSYTANGGVIYSTSSDAVLGQQITPHMDPDGSWTASFSADPSAYAARTGPAHVDMACQNGTADSVQYATLVFDVTTSGSGYWLLSATAMPEACGLCGIGSATDVLAFGDAGFYGPAPSPPAWSAPLVALTANPATGTGYWLTGADGGVANYGDATYHGSLPGLGVHVHDVVDAASTPDAAGYWLLGADGGVFGFGDAAYHGSLPALGVQVDDIVGMAATHDGGGYWLLGADGGVFGFGDAAFEGSMGGKSLAAPVMGMAPSATGAGYLLFGRDGGVFAFGDAPYEGSCSGCTDSAGAPARFVAAAATPQTSAG